MKMSKGLRMSKGIAGKRKAPSFGGKKSSALTPGANTLEQAPPAAGDSMSDYARMMAAGGA